MVWTDKIMQGESMNQEILNKLSGYVSDELLKQPERIIKPDEALLSSGIIDSFHLVDLGLFVEDEFGVRIDDIELSASTFDTLNQLTSLIESRKLGN
jgi:acyl carrier protein